MIEGIFKASFSTPAGTGQGLVHIAAGKIGGGDLILFYTGEVSQDGHNIAATIRTGRHSTEPGIFSLFGKDEVTIKLAGTVSGTTISCRGSSADAPGVPFTATLTKISD